MNNTFDMSRLAADAISASVCTRAHVWSPLTPDGVVRSTPSARSTEARTTKPIDTTIGCARLDKRSTSARTTSSTNDPEILGSPPLWRSN